MCTLQLDKAKFVRTAFYRVIFLSKYTQTGVFVEVPLILKNWPSISNWVKKVRAIRPQLLHLIYIRFPLSPVVNVVKHINPSEYIMCAGI